MKKVEMKDIVNLCQARGFVYQWSEIYGWLANSWDYGPYGALLKENLKNLWIKNFVQKRDDMVLQDAAILMNPQVWVASGHVWGFSDPLIDDKNTKERFRADKLLEDLIENISDKDAFLKKYDLPNLVPESWDLAKQTEVMRAEKVKNPNTWEAWDWSDAKKFNLMYKTFQGVNEDTASTIYMRPETAQGIFVNFWNILRTSRRKLPFWVAQVWKAFRNEITPGNFIFRTREFEQMEIEYFVPADPEKAMAIYNQWKSDCMQYWTEVIGINPEHLRFKDHEKLAHYAAAAVDVEYAYPRWFGEIQGIHNRTNFDLSQHQEYAGKDMQYTDPFTGERYIPWCIEASFGLGRQVMVTMLEFYDEEQLEDGTSRVVVRFPKQLAPIKFAILPLIKKDEEQVALAEQIFKKLSKTCKCEYDDSWAIGKRYRRQDEIWTPYCVTIDHQSKEDGTVTLRHRDSMEQIRVKIEDLINYL